MTESLIVIVLFLLIFGGLELTHRRHPSAWRPGLDTRDDRDLGRLGDDLRAAAQRDPGAATPTEPIHLAPPRSAATDSRLVTRIAA